MKNIKLKISESDFKKYDLVNEEIKFSNLVKKISSEYARQSLLECNEIAKQIGISKMTLEEIDAEIKAVRNVKAHT